MGVLKARQREKMPKRQFAYVDKAGEGHLPIHDEAHVRNAIARFNQTAFESKTAKDSARRRIRNAAKRHGIAISKDDKVAKPVRSLRAAHTKLGPRGGRKVVKKPATTKRASRASSSAR